MISVAQKYKYYSFKGNPAFVIWLMETGYGSC